MLFSKFLMIDQFLLKLKGIKIKKDIKIDKGFEETDRQYKNNIFRSQ